MSTTSLHAASRSMAALGLSGANREVARGWLSLWSENKPPRRTRFLEDCDWRLKPAIATFEVRRNKSLRCIHAGGYFRLALGFELAGQDILALTPAAERQERLERTWAIGNGLIVTGARKFRTRFGAEETAEEIYLPLSDATDLDTRMYLMHSSWRPVGEEWVQGTVATTLELTRDHQSVSLV